jgi:hypothetical protein
MAIYTGTLALDDPQHGAAEDGTPLT